METIHEPARDIPVRYSAEVVVAGGGPAGAAAAICAAGARMENQSVPGRSTHMHRLAICLFIVLFAHSAFAADTRLDKPVTLAVKGEALSDIMPIIEKQTGVRMKVAHDIADQKATIFVDDKPLKEIMAGLQTVFQYTWSYTDFKGERSYSVSMPGRLRREREGWRKKAVDKAWQEFEAEMKRMADMPRKSNRELDEMLEMTESTDDEPPPASRVGGYHWVRGRRAAARLYLAFSPSLRDALRNGMTVCYDLDSPEPEWRIPAVLEDEFRENTVVYLGWGEVTGREKSEARDEYGSLSVEMSVLPSWETLSVEVCYNLGKCGSRGTYSVFPIYEKPLGRIIPLPQSHLPRKDDDPVLDGKVFYASKELEEEAALSKPEAPWLQGTYINRSDLLAILHRKLGLQIIADHYTHFYPWQAAYKLSLRSILQSWERYPGASELEVGTMPPDDKYAIRVMERFPAADWGWDGKLLYMRAANPPKMDSMEVPNRLLRRWQAASRAGGLGLTEMAEIHALTKQQYDMLQDNLQRLGIEPWGIQYFAVNPALRLYGLLSPGQRRLMLDGRFGTRGLTGEQQSALLDLVARTTTSNLGQRKGCRVGVYDAAGRRVDKPDASAYPESVRLESKPGVEGYAIGSRPVALTLEATLKQVKTEEGRAAVRKAVVTKYEMTLAYADGTESKQRFSIITYQPVQLPASPEKSDGGVEEQKP